MNEMTDFMCSTDGTFKFKIDNICYNCSFTGSNDIIVEFNKDNKLNKTIVTCAPVPYESYYDFCLLLAEQIVKHIGD